tara:strand:- start:175 stop:516 length:342 start_codon:yes stop_codon:yes gene_type:complete
MLVASDCFNNNQRPSRAKTAPLDSSKNQRVNQHAPSVNWGKILHHFPHSVSVVRLENLVKKKVPATNVQREHFKTVKAGRSANRAQSTPIPTKKGNHPRRIVWHAQNLPPLVH